MVKKYRTKRRGLAPGLRLIGELREHLSQQLDQFLYHALVVMAEDFPNPGSENDSWKVRVLTAGVNVFTHIVTGKWFVLPIGMAMRIERRYVTVALYGPTQLIELELDAVLANCEHFIDDGKFTDEDLAGWEMYTTGAWMGDILSVNLLHQHISMQSELLLHTDQSYVKSPNFRHYRNLIHGFQK